MTPNDQDLERARDLTDKWVLAHYTWSDIDKIDSDLAQAFREQRDNFEEEMAKKDDFVLRLRLRYTKLLEAAKELDHFEIAIAMESGKNTKEWDDFKEALAEFGEEPKP